MFKGFKAFISRGNMIDLAVGVIIGAAFATLVKALTDDIITPALGWLGGKPQVANYVFFGFKVGDFLNAIINFLILAAGLYFVIVLPFNRFAARLAPPKVATPEELLLKEIRDTLQTRLNPPASTPVPGVSSI